MGKKSTANGEQQQLPGTEDVRNDRVHKAAERYWDHMQERKAALEEEVAAHEQLIRIMDEEGLESYRYKDIQVTLDVNKKAKVKRINAPEE